MRNNVEVGLCRIATLQNSDKEQDRDQNELCVEQDARPGAGTTLRHAERDRERTATSMTRARHTRPPVEGRRREHGQSEYDPVIIDQGRVSLYRVMLPIPGTAKDIVGGGVDQADDGKQQRHGRQDRIQP